MFLEKEQNTVEVKTFSQEILTLNDEFTEFHDQCSFLCDAIASLAKDSEMTDPYSDQGLGLRLSWLKYKVREFQRRIEEIHEANRSVLNSDEQNHREISELNSMYAEYERAIESDISEEMLTPLQTRSYLPQDSK